MATRSWLFVMAAGIGLPALVGAQPKEVRQTLALTAGGRLVIETERGSIRVEGWDNAQAEIFGRVEDDSYFLRDLSAVRETEIRIEATPSQIRIRTDYSRVRERGWGLFGFLAYTIEHPPVHYRVRMPRTARLTIKDHRSETTVAGLKSDLEMETHRGWVDVRGHDGAVEFKSHRGEALFKLAGLPRASRVETYRGDITLSLPRDRGFQLDADLGRHGSLSSDFEIPNKNLSRDHKSYRGTVNGGGPDLRVKSERGTVRLRRL